MNTSGTFRKQLSFLLALAICAVLLAGCNTSGATPLSPDGGEALTYQMEIVLLGKKTEGSVDGQGKLRTYLESSSNDGEISLSIREDTTLLDKNGKPLSFIEATIVSNPLPPPEGAHIVGAVYDLKPQGATFDPPLVLTLAYDPEQLPEGARESDIYILPYDEDAGWGESSYKRVDTENHRVATYVNHSARFAVLVSASPEDKPASGASSEMYDRVEVVYFHRPSRCYSCEYAEAATQFTLESYFAEELASGKLAWKTVNLGDDANAAIVEQYGAHTSSLFINGVKGNTEHIEEVIEIWFLIGKDNEVVNLLKSKIDRYLSEEEL